jgi:chromosome segregation ATPase
MSILDSVLEKVTGKQRQAVGTYGEFVRLIADDKEPDTARLADVLRETGKSAEDLRTDVALLQRRRELRKSFDAAEPARKRLAEIRTALDKIEVRREAAEKKLDDERWPLECEIDRLNAAVAKAATAQEELSRTCPDPAILKRTAEIAAEREALGREKSAIRRELNEACDAVAEVAAGRSTYPDAAVATCDQRKARAEQSVADLQNELSRLADEMATIDRRRLEV